MSADEFAGVAFAPGSVRGTRSFRVTEDGYLRARIFETKWQAGVNEAACNRKGQTCGYMPDAGSVHRHGPACSGPTPCGPRSPGKDCKCGFYAYYDGSLDYADKFSVCGVVEGFGLVSLGSRGFRAEKARILAVFIPEPMPTEAPETFLPHHEIKNRSWVVRVPTVRPAFLTDSLIRLLRNRYDVPFYTDLAVMLADFPPDPPSAEGGV